MLTKRGSKIKVVPKQNTYAMLMIWFIVKLVYHSWDFLNKYVTIIVITFTYKVKYVEKTLLKLCKWAKLRILLC